VNIWSQLAMCAIIENNHVLMNERRPDGIVIEKQQGMEDLGAYLSPSMSIKDRTAVGTSVKIECMLNHYCWNFCRISHSDHKAE
jgi:hypothetical protein